MASTDDTTPTPTGTTDQNDPGQRDDPQIDDPHTDTAQEPAVDSAGTAPRTAAKKTARKRATRKTATADSEGATGAPPAVEGEPASSPGAQDDMRPPAKEAVRKRASRKVTAPTAALAAAARATAGAPSPDLPDGMGRGVMPADGVTDEEPRDPAEGDGAAAVSSFGVLFQAPTPTVRSRRASAPAAEPRTEASLGAAESDDESHDREDERDDGSGGAEEPVDAARRRRRRGGKGRRGRVNDTDPDDDRSGPAGGRNGRRGSDTDDHEDSGAGDDPDAGTDEVDDSDGQDDNEGEGGEGASRRRTRRRRRSGSSGEADDAPGVVTRVREPRRERDRDDVTGLKGSTRLEAKKQRRREGREAGRRRTVITEAEFLARRESVERVMVVRTKDDRTQIGVLEDDVLVEHYISRETSVSMAGNIYLGRVQNVLPSMEAAFVDIGKGRNAVLYAGEVNWDAAGLEANQPKRIENALSSGEPVLVQVTKDPIGHKGARLTSQISLPGRYLVYVPDSSMTGISRKLPDTERARLKKILKEVVPESAGVIVRTAAEGASEDELRADVERLTKAWEDIQAKAESAGFGKGKAKTKGGGTAPLLLHGEPDLTVRVIRDVFNEDFASLVVGGQQAWDEVSDYVGTVAPDLAERVTRWTSEEDLFTHYRIDEQIAKAMDRKVWLPSGGSLVIDRTEAMTVVDVNTGKFIGSGGNLEETVTKNNIEAAEEIVRQLRLRDIGGIIVVDFIDMVLESNRELVVRRLLECLGRDRTKHQVAEVTSLGLVQMTRKRVGSGLIEVFGEVCEHCNGRGIIVHADPVDRGGNGFSEQGGTGHSSTAGGSSGGAGGSSTGRGIRGRRGKAPGEPIAPPKSSGPTPAQIAAAAHAAALKSGDQASDDSRQGARPDASVDPAAEDGGPDRPASLPAREQATQEATEEATEERSRPTLEELVDPAQAPTGRGRRRRGRVVAPAGPPRSAGQERSRE